MMPKKMDLIMVPTDFSGLSCEAFSWAALLAEKFNARILIVNVVSERVAVELTSKPGNPWEKVLEQEDATMIENFKSCMLSDINKSVEVQPLVEVGDAAEKLVKAASENHADLIIMATHGRTGLFHALMGSVAEKVVRQAPCPVLTIRPEGESTA